MNTTKYGKEVEQMKVKGNSQQANLIRICAKTQCTPNCYVMSFMQENAIQLLLSNGSYEEKYNYEMNCYHSNSYFQEYNSCQHAALSREWYQPTIEAEEEDEVVWKSAWPQLQQPAAA